MAFHRLKNWYNSQKQKYNDWYNNKYYPIRRRLNYHLSIDLPNIKRSLKLRNIHNILRNPDEFVGYFETRTSIRGRRREAKLKQKLKDFPFYKQAKKQLEKLLAQTQRERDNYENLHAELVTSVEAANARIGAGEIKRLEEIVTKQKEVIQSLTKSEEEIGGKYGQERMKVGKLEDDIAAKRQTIFNMDMQVKQALYEKDWADAILEDTTRKYATIDVDRDKLIKMLRRSVHEKEESFVGGSLREVVDFVNRNPGALLIIGPGLDGLILEASKDAKEVLNYNGDLIGRRYSEVLAFNPQEKRRALVYFSKPEEQRVIVPIVDRNGRTYKVWVANKPIMSRVPGEERHLCTIATVSSVGWWENRYGGSKKADLRLVLEEEERNAAEKKVRQEKIRQVVEEAKREVEKTIPPGDNLSSS